jgi:hypothetical protein
MASGAIISSGATKAAASVANRGINASGFEIKDGLDSIYGVTIPLYFGRARARGYPIYAKKTGTGAQTGDAIIAVAFGKPASNAYRTALTRLWIGGTLVVDTTEKGGTSALLDFEYKFYTGTEDQMPDPTISGIEGVGKVPGFRGIMYLVLRFPDYVHSRFYAALAGGIPLIEAEIAQSPQSPHRLASLGSDLGRIVNGSLFADFVEGYYYVIDATLYVAHVYDLTTNEAVGSITFNTGSIGVSPSFRGACQLSRKGGVVYATHTSSNRQPYCAYDLRSGQKLAQFGPDVGSQLGFDPDGFGVADYMAVALDQRTIDPDEFLFVLGGVFSQYGLLRFTGNGLGFRASGTLDHRGNCAVGARLVVNPFASTDNNSGMAVFYYGSANTVRSYEYYGSAGSARRVRKWRWLDPYIQSIPFTDDPPRTMFRAPDTLEHFYSESGTTGFHTVITLPVAETVIFCAVGPKENPWLAVLSVEVAGTFTYRRYSTPWSGDATITKWRDPGGVKAHGTPIPQQPLGELFPSTYDLEVTVTGIPGTGWNMQGIELFAHIAPLIADKTTISFADSFGNLTVLDMASGNWQSFGKADVSTGQTIIDIDDPDTEYSYSFSNSFTWDEKTFSVLNGDLGSPMPNPQRTYVLPLTKTLKIKLSDLLLGYALAVGYTEDQISVDGIDDDEITGSIINAPTPFVDVITQVCALFRIDIIETSGVLRFIRKGRGDDLVIDLEVSEATDLVPLSEDRDDAKVVIKERDVSFEIPSTLELSYIDEANNYGVGMVPVKRSGYAASLSRSYGSLAIGVPIIMTTAEAAYWATNSLFDIWGGAVTHDIRLPSKSAAVEPSDYLRLTMLNGNVFVLKAETVTLNGDLSLSIKSRSIQEYADFTQIAEPPPVNSDDPIVITRPENAFLFDNFLLNYADNNQSKMMVAWATRQLAAIYQDTTLISIGLTTIIPCYATSLLRTRDDTNLFCTDESSLTLRAPYGFSNITVSYDDWLAGVNAAVIGDIGRWELVFFRNVSVSGQIVTIDTFARGRRGTDTMVNTHTAIDYVIILPADRDQLAAFGIEPEDIGNSITLTTVVNGSAVVSATNKTQELIGSGGPLKPWAPSSVVLTKNGSDIDITWHRRTRLNSVLHDLDGITPLDEATEAYEIDIYVGSTFKRTLTSTSETVKYLAASMATDGVTFTTALTVNVYQISAKVGRGYAGGGVRYV